MEGSKADKALATLAASVASKREAKEKAAIEARRAKQRTAKQAPRRVYLTQDNMRIAWLAGNGKSGGEIAEAIGGTTRYRIASLLRRFGLSLLGRNPSDRVLVVMVNGKSLDRITHAAVERDLDPAALAGRLLTILGSEAALLKNLLDDEGE